MSLIQIFLIAIGLAMDAFAVSLASGISLKKSYVLWACIIAIFFGGFQALMPIIGWYGGSLFQTYINSFDHWIAFGLLIIIGCRMIYEAFCSHQGKKTHTSNKAVRIVWARHCHQHRRTCCGIKFFIAGHTDLFTSTFDRCGDICSFVLRSYDGQITGSKMGRKSTRFWRNCIDPNRY